MPPETTPAAAGGLVPARLRRWATRRVANRVALWVALLTLGLLALALVAALALTRWMAGSYEAALLDMRAGHAARGAADTLAQFESGVQALALNTFVINALSDSEGRDAYLGPFLAQHPLHRQGAALRLCDSDNTVIGSDGSARAGAADPQTGCGDAASVQQALAGGTRLVALHTDGSGGTWLALAVPVLFPLTNTHEGVLLARLPLAALQAPGSADATVHVAGAPPPGSDGAEITRPLVLPETSALAPLRLAVRVGLPPGTGELPFAPVVVGYLLLGLLLAALAVAVTQRLVRRIVAPLDDLATLSRHAASGQAVVLPPQLDTPDEIGALARAFRQMADSMGDANRRLAAQVDALVQARNEAQAANVAKSEFLAMMSHEIRTPMNAVLGMLYLALRAPMEPRQREQVGKAQRAAQALLGVINDILDFSRIDAGKLAVDPQPFEVDALVAGVAETLELAAADKGLALQVDVDPALPTTLEGDAPRLRQVLINLLGNAVKFTDHGRVSLRLRCQALAPERCVIGFEVEDSGIGMTPEQQAALFQPFSQVDASASRRHQGSGLGLAISQRLVGLMGGRLEVHSTAGLGSLFTFTLALARPAQQPAAPVAAPAAGPVAPVPALLGRRVLVVDDNEINRQIAVELLAMLGVTPLQAAGGAQALDLLASVPAVDAVLMDCHMPGMDGYAATRQLRADARWRTLPVIAMTAGVLDDDRAACLAAGMNDHVAKPITPEQLQQQLQRWLPARPA
ncbi:ATP-binding protein [Rubrivivax sp. RP6-9]|uniref:ATP-binding protein n=1 Tax=Rubrivivax sp. RP6-9 TaxID=3415750 RepID=UPI003CC59642